LRGEAEVGGAEDTVDQEATMDADLDTLCTVVYCTADDLLPVRPGNARRMVTDAEVVTLCVAQAIMGIPSQSPGFKDELLLIDSTPVECARSRETVKRSALAEAADYGWCASHSRYFWGFRLHALFALDGTPRALILASPKRDDREVGLTLLERCNRNGGETVLGDKNYAGRDFARAVSDLDATIVRPRRKDEPGHSPHLAPIRQRIESIFWTCKDLLTLERHGARTLQGLKERVLQRFLTLAACVTLNHQLGRPSRALVDYVA
jgi:hypothetical protein